MHPFLPNCTLLFTETVHYYLPKLYIAIYRNRTLLFTNYGTLLFTDYTRVIIIVVIKFVRTD